MGWIFAIAADLIGEFLGDMTFTDASWFERLSVEHTGFSVLRILAGVIVGVPLLLLIILLLIIFGVL